MYMYFMNTKNYRFKLAKNFGRIKLAIGFQMPIAKNWWISQNFLQVWMIVKGRPPSCLTPNFPAIHFNHTVGRDIFSGKILRLLIFRVHVHVV